MNTDNFSILGTTIDYGPFGFLDVHDQRFVPNTSDDEEIYAFGAQPDVAKKNILRSGHECMCRQCCFAFQVTFREL